MTASGLFGLPKMPRKTHEGPFDALYFPVDASTLALRDYMAWNMEYYITRVYFLSFVAIMLKFGVILV